MSLIIKSYCVISRSIQTSSHLKYLPQLFCYDKNISKIIKPVSTQLRYFSDQKNKRAVNDISKDYELIYQGSLSTKIKYVKIFSLSTSAASIAAQSYLIPQIWGTASAGLTFSLIASMSLFTFVTPIILHYVTNRYAIELYHDPKRDAYLMVLYTIFVTKRKVEFMLRDVEKPKLMQYMTTCFVKGRPVFFNYDDFKDPDYYRILMGYNKPMDFSIPNRAVPSINAAPSNFSSPSDDKK